MTVWSIVAPGLTLDWSAIDPDPPVICINRALKDAKRCDYWCCIDSPNPEHERCLEDAQRLRPVVLTQKRRAQRWSAWHGIELRVQHEAIPVGCWVFDAKKGGPRYSMVSAISFCVAQGAEEIRFYGVTMSGYGYHDGPPDRVGRGENEAVKRNWAVRWSAEGKELDQMRRIYKAAEERGFPLVGLPEHVTRLDEAPKQ